MVQVPILNEGAVLRGRGQQNRTTQTSAAGVDGGFGQALQNIGRGLGSVAEAIDVRDTIKAEADARDAVGKLRDATRDTLYDPESGYLTQTGGNALDGTREAAEDSFSKTRSRLREGLSPRAQREFDRQADQIEDRTKDLTIRHEGVELKNYTNAQLEASAQGHLDDAIRASERDELFNESVAAAEQEVRRANALNGGSPEQLEQQLKGVQDAAHSGRVVALANNDPIAAWDYLQANKDKIAVDNFDKLHDQLRPVWNAARAREWVSGQNVSTGTSRFERLGIPSFIYSPESGGDVNARNAMGSGAGGVVQFMPGTYLSLVKRMQQDGAAPWSVGMTDKQILETRFGEGNLEKTAEVYREFRSNNQDALRGAGVPVTPRTEYMAHHLGAGGAIKLFNAARSGASSKTMKQHLIDTLGRNTQEKWFEQNPWMRGKTVGGALDWFARKTQTDSVVAPGIAMAEAATIEDPELREAVMRELNTRIAAEETTKSAEQAQANEEAWSIIDQGGTPQDIPPDLAVRVGTTTMNEIMNATERRMQGVDQNDFATYEELDAMAKDRDQRSDFMKLDLNDHRDRLSQASFIELRDLQREMREEQARIERDGLSSVVFPVKEREAAIGEFENRFMAMMGGKTDDLVAERWPELQRQFRGMLTQFANQQGAAPGPNEMQSMFEALMLPVVIENDPEAGVFSSPARRLFDVAQVRRGNAAVEIEADIGTVGAREFDRISSEFERKFGRPPTEDEVVEQFENELLLSFGVSPSIEFGEIPKDIRRTLVDEFPGASDQELTDLYKAQIVEMAIGEDLLR